LRAFEAVSGEVLLTKPIHGFWSRQDILWAIFRMSIFHGAHMKTLRAALLILIAAANCSAATPLKLSVVTELVDGKAKVSCTTNLPDGTKLLVGLHRNDIGYHAEADALVSAGKFQAGPFGTTKEALLAGTYFVEVIAPVSVVQPPAVRKVIGENYSQFTSPWKVGDSLGTTIEYKVRFVVGGKVDPQKVAAAKAEQQLATQRWLENSCRSNPDLAAALVQQRITPQQRKAMIDECLAEVRKHNKSAPK
jgi:hypothetical protein